MRPAVNNPLRQLKHKSEPLQTQLTAQIPSQFTFSSRNGRGRWWFSTESEDSDGAPDHSAVAKHPSSEQPNERRDSDSEEDALSHLGKDRLSRVRKDWKTVEAWNREVYGDEHIEFI